MLNLANILGAADLPLAVLTTWHIVVLALAILLLFGGKKLPELARGLARGMRIFRDELHSTTKDVTDTMENPPPANREQPKQLGPNQNQAESPQQNQQGQQNKS